MNIFKKALFIMCIFILTHCVCSAEDQHITLGSQGAGLYEQTAAYANPFTRIPPATTLTIMETTSEPAFPRYLTWYKVTYEGKTGWVMETDSVDAEIRRKEYAAKREANFRRWEQVAKIADLSTTETDIRQWFGDPEKITDNPSSKTFTYQVSYEIPEGDCWKELTLNVVIDKGSGKVISHQAGKIRESCA